MTANWAITEGMLKL